MSVDTPEQLKGLERVGRVVAATLRVLRGAVAPGVTTGDLDRLAGGSARRSSALRLRAATGFCAN